MKKNLLLLLLLPLTWLAGCDDDNDALPTATVTVTVRNPDNYAEPLAKDTRVTLTNTDNGQAQTVSTDDAAGRGVATFADVLPGTYTVAATRALTAAQAQQLTGIGSALVLNASKTGVAVAAGSATVELQLAGSALGGLVIKEAYYTGSKTPSGGNYFSDQFFEIYNNSTGTIFLDSLCIADVYGASGQINPTTRPSEFQNDAAHTYVNSVWQIPGTGRQHPLLPGQSVVIAQDGVNHPALNANSAVDLSRAEWETFNQRPDGADADAPGVPNLTRLYFTGGFDWLVTVFGPGIVIFKTRDFGQLQQVAIPNSAVAPRIKVPNALILDAFEALRDGSSASFKRIPAALDAGFAFATDTYTGESLRRRTEATVGGRRVLKDTNNSGPDFEKLARPTPKGF